jgi:hypothetical protein
MGRSYTSSPPKRLRGVQWINCSGAMETLRFQQTENISRQACMRTYIWRNASGTTNVFIQHTPTRHTHNTVYTFDAICTVWSDESAVKNYETPKPEEPVSGPRFWPGTSGIFSRGANRSTAVSRTEGEVIRKQTYCGNGKLSLFQRSPTVCLSICVITETPKGALCYNWEPNGK